MQCIKTSLILQLPYRLRYVHQSSKHIKNYCNFMSYNCNYKKFLYNKQKSYMSSTTHNKSYYDILGISRNATPEEIKLAYKKKALQYHPDRNQGPNLKEAETKFKEVSLAYETLSNSEKKKSYDIYGENYQNSYYEQQQNPFTRSRGNNSYHTANMSVDEATELFRTIFGSAFGKSIVEELSKNMNATMKDTGNSNSSFVERSVNMRNGRMIETIRTVKRTLHVTQEIIEERDIGTKTNNPFAGNAFRTHDNNFFFSAWHDMAENAMNQAFAEQKQAKPQTRRIYREQQKARNLSNKFDEDFRTSVQLKSQNSLFSKFSTTLRTIQESQPFKQFKFLVRLSMYNAFVRITTRMFERIVKSLIFHIFRRGGR